MDNAMMFLFMFLIGAVTVSEILRIVETLILYFKIAEMKTFSKEASLLDGADRDCLVTSCRLTVYNDCPNDIACGLQCRFIGPDEIIPDSCAWNPCNEIIGNGKWQSVCPGMDALKITGGCSARLRNGTRIYDKVYETGFHGIWRTFDKGTHLGDNIDQMKMSCPVTVPCIAGTYLSGYGCSQCPMNSYSEDGATECMNCPDGKEAPSGSKLETECTWIPCSAGNYLTDFGCAQCPVNTYSLGSSTECTPCPDGSESSVGSTSIEACGNDFMENPDCRYMKMDLRPKTVKNSTMHRDAAQEICTNDRDCIGLFCNTLSACIIVHKAGVGKNQEGLYCNRKKKCITIQSNTADDSKSGKMVLLKVCK